MRLLLFLFGIALGVAGTLAYAMFANQTHAEVVAVARPLPQNPPITVTLGEPFLTGIVRRAALETPGVAVAPTQLRTELRDGVIIVHANVEVLGHTTDATATLRPVLRDGQLRIDVVKTSVGTMPIPALDQVLEQQINARVQSLLAALPATITGVEIDHVRGLTITCSVDLDKLELRAGSGAHP
ncbi:MAG: hypothetical protein ABI467_03540 [Kofleriaceae bacterium]